jgi:hypothetical protein
MQAQATPRTPQGARAFAQPHSPESPDPIASTGPTGPVGPVNTGPLGPPIPTATRPTTPPTRTDLQGPRGPVSPTADPCNALQPAVPNRPVKAPGGTFGMAGPPGIGSKQSATGAYSSESFDFQVPRGTTTEQGPAKRPKKRAFQPTSPSPTLQTASDLLQQALRLVQQAYAKEPNEATESAIRALKGAIGGGSSGLSLEQKVDLLLQKANLQPNQQGQQAPQAPHLQQIQQKPQGLQASKHAALQAQPASYASIAAQKPTEEPWKVVESTKKPRSTQQPSKTKPKEPERVIVRVSKGPTDYSPLAIRNELNQKLKSIMVAKVATSQKDNFVITLLPNHTAAEFMSQESYWLSTFESYGI